MHRIEAPGATVDNLFTEGNPSTGIPATTVSAAILNAVQEEICNVIEEAGITLQTAGTDTWDQLASAIQALSISYFEQSLGASGWTKFPNGLIMQWGSISVPQNGIATFNFPIAFPNSVFQGWGTYDNPPYAGNYPVVAVGNFTNNTADVGAKTTSAGNYIIRVSVIGH